MSPDRARLYDSGDQSVSDQAPARWNHWLFRDPIPVAWTGLLSHLARLCPDKSLFGKWPRIISGNRDLQSGIVESIVRIIDKEALPLWPTSVGYVKADMGLLCTSRDSKAPKRALEEAKAPIIYIPEELKQKVEHLFKDRILCTRTLGSLLRTQTDLTKLWSDRTKESILEYFLSDSGYLDYGNLELFPFEDGEYRSLINHTAFLHRNELEKELFSLEKSSNLDLHRITITARRLLKTGCESSKIHPGIRYRSACSLAPYCLKTIFKGARVDEDVILLNSEGANLVSEVWDWIREQGISIMEVDNGISDLWLIPLSNNKYRKIKPRHSSSCAVFAPEGCMGDLLREIDGISPEEARVLLKTGPTGLNSQSVQLLLNASKEDPTLLIKDGRKIVHLAQWLCRLSHVVRRATDELKSQVQHLIAANLPLQSERSDLKAMAIALRELEIFRKLSWQMDEAGSYVRPKSFLLVYANL
jgi:sacsin